MIRGPTRTLVLIGVALLAAACAGCGSSRPEASRSTPVGAVLLTRSDLPGGTTIQPSLPEECGPLPILRQNGGRAAATEMFGLGETRMEEAVGAFPDPSAAVAAYRELTSRERRACIAGAIESLAPGAAGGGPVAPRGLPSRRLSYGDAASLQRYLVGGPSSSTASSMDVISIRSGRCVATFLLLSERPGAGGFTATGLSRAASRRARDDCR